MADPSRIVALATALDKAATVLSAVTRAAEDTTTGDTEPAGWGSILAQAAALMQCWNGLADILDARVRDIGDTWPNLTDPSGLSVRSRLWSARNVTTDARMTATTTADRLAAASRDLRHLQVRKDGQP